MATMRRWLFHPEVAARLGTEASSGTRGGDAGVPVGGHQQAGAARQGSRFTHWAGPSGTGAGWFTEVSSLARAWGCGSLAFPAFRHGLGGAVSSSADLHGSTLGATGGVPAVGRPLLAFASCVDSVVTSPTRRSPRGPSVRVHARPLRNPEIAGRSCHPSSAVSWNAMSEDAVLPGEQPLSRCLVPAPEGAGSSPTRGPAGGVPGTSVLPSCRSRRPDPWSRASSTRRSPLVRRSEALPKKRSFPTGVERGRPQAACHVESCRTPLMVFSKIRPSIDIPTVCPLPARCRPRPNEVPTGVDIGLTEMSLTTSLRAFGPKQPCFESCSARAVSHDFGGLRHTMRCGSVAPRCRPWGPPGCRLPTRSRPSPCKHVLSRSPSCLRRVHP
jgi:hypothetical protein